MRLRFSPIALAVAAAIPALAIAQATELESVVVTAPALASPTSVTLNPKNAIQPLPANDGASFLKAIPGMNVIRKGGTDGDPTFRGMAGSRLNILIDGEQIYGGCGGRMDPPTAYVFPETYDKVTLIKGPQTVQYAPGGSAGTVLFERKSRYFSEPTVTGNASLTVGSYGRHDEVLSATAGNSLGYVRANATNSASDDYADGDGKKVHSRYERTSQSAAIGWTPDAHTVLELSATQSDAKAAYADRSVDGSKFHRENLSARFEKRNISDLIEKVEASTYYNYVDHVMDNYSLRKFTPASSAMMGATEPSAMNPDRTTLGSRAAVTLRPLSDTQLVLGADVQENKHTGRSSMSMKMGNMWMGGQWSNPYQDMARTPDAKFTTTGLFGELTQHLNEQQRVMGGLRVDHWTGADLRSAGGMSGSATGGKSRSENLTSGFARYEHDLAAGATAYAGLGHTERAPDYWEVISAQSLNTNSAFLSTKPEKTDQLDIGTTWRSGALTGFVSGFYSKVKDYVLIQYKSASSNAARNVDATVWGSEAGVNYAISNTVKTGASLAYTRGSNDTDGTPLAQISPLEARLTANYDYQKWSAGALIRAVSRQTQVAVGQGNIAGRDIGETGGFTTVAIHGAYRVKKDLTLAAGVDNLFNRTYAEHISRAGSSLAGYTQTTRINEPGQVIWLRAQLAF